MKTRKGITIGAGHFANIQMEAWSRVNGAEIGGIVSLHKEDAIRLSERFGIAHASNSLDEMIAWVKPDFMDICTPPDSHFYYVKQAANRGIPVLCQKQVAPTQEESRELVQYCTDRNVPIMINENWRWSGWYREIKRIISTGVLGRLFHVYSAMRTGDGYGESPYPLQPYFKDMDKLLLYETAVHWFDTYRYLFGEIQSVYCQKRTWNPVVKGEDAVIVQFDFRNGMTGVLDANRVVYTEIERPPAYGWMILEGEQGKLRLDEHGRIYVTLRGSVEQEHRYTIPEGWNGGCATGAQQHFIDCLRSGAPFETEGEVYLTSQRIVYACYESAEHRKVVEI
ncbi:Gfo/Idh/MocA family oxidoreductase [Paenibacillus qinlingensis]|uniref:Dehydrogenase n=1 Tax=Paenibacillus qinlingensis TaxID=1837343 RepID=A0ABU1NU57_9BACL|nr:Gfo/Idh/MocA family oxidoreductase [Paenibacillus qinlingensis]MDR6550864.1 putative dehydrogenase [Paenibacillus qinlingensis]